MRLVITPSAFIRRQTAINVAASILASLIPFLIVFEISLPVYVWGVGNYVFDFLPQGFMIALMSILMPGVSAGKALREGTLSPLAGPTRPIAHLAIRAILFGAFGAVLGAALAAGFLSLVDVPEIDWNRALAAKVVFGGLLAAIVTPIGLRTALSHL